MDTKIKLWIIILIIILITFRTFIDLLYSINYNFYNKEPKDKLNQIYDKYMNIKAYFDIPIVLLAIFLLFNIKFNIKIYLFLFFGILNIIIDRYFEYLHLPLDHNVTIFMEKYYVLFSDIIILSVGTYVLYKIFNIS